MKIIVGTAIAFSGIGAIEILNSDYAFIYLISGCVIGAGMLLMVQGMVDKAKKG